MRYFLLILFSVLFQLCTAQTGITWNSAIDLAPSSSGNNHPRITTDANGNPLVVWSHANRAMFSRWNGTAFTTPVLVNPPGIDVAGASWMGPDIASHGDTVYIVFKQVPENADTCHIFCTRSFNGGLTFDNPVQVDNIADSLSRFPTITTDESGNPVIGFMKFNAAFLESRWVVTRSSDYGLSFTVDTKASGWSSPTSVICDCCPGAVVSSGNTVAMLYRDNNSDVRDIWTGISTDGGNSFYGGMNIDQNSWVINACPATGPDGVIIGDTLYSTFMSGAGGNSLVYRSATSLSGMTGSQSIELTGNFSGLSQQNYPRIASDGTALAIVWKQRVNGADQCILRFSQEAGTFATAGIDTVDLDNVTNADVALGGGKIFVVWEDDASGTIRFRSGNYSSTTDIINTQVENEISIYPNPTASRISITSRDVVDEIMICNLLGEIVCKEFPCKKEFQISIKNTGTYFVNLISGKNILKRKISVLR